MDMLKAISRN